MGLYGWEFDKANQGAIAWMRRINRLETTATQDEAIAQVEAALCLS